MVQLFVQWLPDQVGIAAVAIAIAGACAGAVLWLSGARFSRALVGLAMVAIGAAVGMSIPRWMGWNISGAGPAVGLALVGGVAGYIFHLLWIGIGLGTVLAGWAFLATWVALKAPVAFGWPMPSSSDSVRDYAVLIWQSLPANVAHVLPLACAAAMMLGLIATVFWPRLAIASAWSAAGASMVAALGSAAMEFGRPQWIALLPRQLGSQVLGFATLVVIGAAAQWKTAQIAAGQVGSANEKPGSNGGANGGVGDKPSPRPPSEGAD